MLFLPIGDGMLCRKQPICDYVETQCVVAPAIAFVIILVVIFPNPNAHLY